MTGLEIFMGLVIIVGAIGLGAVLVSIVRGFG